MEFNGGRGGSGDAQPPRCSDVAVFDASSVRGAARGLRAPSPRISSFAPPRTRISRITAYRRRQARDRQTLGDALVEHRAIVTAGLVRGARKPAFADTGRTAGHAPRRSSGRPLTWNC